MSEGNADSARHILGSYADPVPDKLIEALKDGCCVLLAGSGVSRRCLARNRKPLPSWHELLTSLLSRAREKSLLPPETVTELDSLLSRDEYLMVAQDLLETLGEVAVRDLLNDALDPDGIVPSRLHELLAITPFRFRITTNYDNLLERAFVGIWNRHIERVCLDELTRLDSLMQLKTEFVLKLHGDLDRPETIVLGQRHYQFLLQNREYAAALDGIFRNNSVLMLGYGLGDIDILLTLDRLALSSPSRHPHYLLCSQGSRTRTEKKRLAVDRNVHVIEYVDYFGFHNHLDTFLSALNVELGNSEALKRILPKLRARIAVHYPEHLSADGLFVWNLLFREGAITLSEEPQREQLRYLDKRLSDGFTALDYLLFVTDEKGLKKGHEFLAKVKKGLRLACSLGVQPIFLILGAKERPQFLTKRISAPTFYVEKEFSERDLSQLRSYIAQDIQMGYRQA